MIIIPLMFMFLAWKGITSYKHFEIMDDCTLKYKGNDFL